MINFDAQNNFVLDQAPEWASWLGQVVASEGFSLGSVDYVFCNDVYLLELNQEFLSHDTLTDIITFDYNVGRTVHGEIYISTERVVENSREYGVSMAEELGRVMVHGILHLCGYKDKSESEQQIMRSREDYWLGKSKTLLIK